MIYDGEKFIESIFNNLCKDLTKVKHNDENLLPGWHFGYYDQDTHSYNKSIYEMNKYVENLLALDNTPKVILDVGCGIGSTMIQIDKTHSESQFYGIALGSEEIKYAQCVQSHFNLKNIHFSQQSYLNTNFPDEFFDVIYALESVSCGINDTTFLDEMKRILKPNGRLIILDLFPRIHRTSFIDTIRKYILHENLQGQSQRTIHSFRTSLTASGLTLLTEIDLKKQHHVRYILATSFVLLYIKLSTEIKEFRKKKVIYLPSLMFHFASRFIVYTFLLITLDYGYFSLIAVKNPNIQYFDHKTSPRLNRSRIKGLSKSKTI